MVTQNKALIIFGALVVGVIALLIFARAASDTLSDKPKYWNDTAIACIPGHQNLAQHIHPELSISVDGAEEKIPASVGISSTCMAEIHTHDATGAIHIETVEAGKVFTLADFFVVWDKSLQREGYTLKVTVQGEEVANPNAIPLRDHDVIALSYTRVGDESSTDATAGKPELQ